MRAGDVSKLDRIGDAGKAHEVADVVAVGAAGLRAIEIGKPFRLGRNGGEIVELGNG